MLSQPFGPTRVSPPQALGGARRSKPPRARRCSRFPFRCEGDGLRWWTRGSGCVWRRNTRDASLRRCHLFGANHLFAGGNRQVRPRHPTCLSSNDSRLHPVRSTRPFGDPRIGVGHRPAERRHHRRKRSLPATPHARRRVIPPTPARRRPRRGSSGSGGPSPGATTHPRVRRPRIRVLPGDGA